MKANNATNFTLEDFLDQIKMIKRMGSMKDLMKMIPGLGDMLTQAPHTDADKDMCRIEALINSMTPFERTHPDRIDRSRLYRIARGAGSDPADVDRLLKDFKVMADMAQKMSGIMQKTSNQMSPWEKTAKPKTFRQSTQGDISSFFD